MGKTRKRVSKKRVRSRVRSQKGGKCCWYEGKGKEYGNLEEEEEKECWKQVEDFGPPGLVGANAAKKGNTGCVFRHKKTKQCVSWRPELTELLTAADPIGVWYSNHFWKHFDAVAGMECYNPGHLQTFVKGFVPNMYIGHERTPFNMFLLDLQATAESLAQMPPKYEYLEAGVSPDGAKPTHSSDNWAAFRTILELASPQSKFSAIGEDRRIPGVGGYRLVFNPGNWGQPSNIDGMLLFALVPLPAQGFSIAAGQAIGAGTAYPQRPHPTAFNDIKFNSLPTHHYNNIQANNNIIAAAASPQVASGSGGGGGGGGGAGDGETELKRLQATTLMMEQYMKPGIEGFVQQGVLSKHDETSKAYKARNKGLGTDQNTVISGSKYLDHWRNIEEAKAVLTKAQKIQWIKVGVALEGRLISAIKSAQPVAEQLKDACDAAETASTATAKAAADGSAAAATAAEGKTTELDTVIRDARIWVRDEHRPEEIKDDAQEALDAVEDLLPLAVGLKKCILTDAGSCKKSAECLAAVARINPDAIKDFQKQQADADEAMKAMIQKAGEAKAAKAAEVAEAERAAGAADALAAGSLDLKLSLPAGVPPVPTGAAAGLPQPPTTSTKRRMGRTMGATKKTKEPIPFDIKSSQTVKITRKQQRENEAAAAEAQRQAGLSRAQQSKKGKGKGKKGGIGGGRARTRKRQDTTDNEEIHPPTQTQSRSQNQAPLAMLYVNVFI